MTFLRKKQAPSDPPADGSAAGGGEWSSSLPALLEFLAAVRWSDGTSRVPGTITLFADAGAWKLCLADKDQGRVAFVSASDPQGALSAAERGLVSDSLDWRAQRANSSAPRRK